MTTRLCLRIDCSETVNPKSHEKSHESDEVEEIMRNKKVKTSQPGGEFDRLSDLDHKRMRTSLVL